jgi:hypothetical protein
MSGISRRVRRIKRTRPSKRPANFDSLDEMEQLTWYVRQGRLTELVRGGEEAKPDEKPVRPEPAVEEAPRPAPVETKAAPPVQPFRARYAGEPDPTALPPQNQYWEEKCRFRFPGPEDAYVDEPEQDELDELIYGSE